MTQPPPGWPSGEPQDPQHGAWQPPPAAGAPGSWPQQPSGPGEWQAPQQPGGWPQQPAADQPGWGAPQPGEPSGPWEPLGGPGDAPQAPRSRGRGKLIASAAVVVALVAGGVATYVALSDKNTTGASSPRKAVTSIVADMNKSDLIGVLEDLAPGERAALVNPTLDNIGELKRLKVLQKGADPKSVTGVSFAAHGLTFDDKTITINDRVRIVQLTGGTLKISADAAKVPFTRDFLDAAFPHGLPAQSSSSTQIDIATAVREQGNQPIRIATQKVGSTWYPSIFYTVADNAAHHAVPTPADAIAAVGGSSPQDAVKRMVNALLRGDTTGAVKLLSPDELAVMHDYGGLFLRKAGSYRAPSVTLKNLQLKTDEVSGGATRVLLRSVTVASSNGQQSTVTVDGSCIEVTAPGANRRMCTSDLVTQILNAVQGFGVSLDVTPAQRQALGDLLSGLTKVGVDTTQSGGKWYVNPVRSYLDVTSSVLSGLKDNDLLELFGFFAKLGSR